jgi:hypothetical protein
MRCRRGRITNHFLRSRLVAGLCLIYKAVILWACCYRRGTFRSCQDEHFSNSRDHGGLVIITEIKQYSKLRDVDHMTSRVGRGRSFHSQL